MQFVETALATAVPVIRDYIRDHVGFIAMERVVAGNRLVDFLT